MVQPFIQPAVNELVIVKFATKKLDRIFGKIENDCGDQLTINVTRNKGISECYFFYPEIPDVCLITRD